MRIQVTGGSFGGAIDRDTVERLSGLFEVKVLQSLYYPNATWTMGGDTRTIMVFGFLGKALQAPGTPWCAVALHPGFLEQHGASAWIGDFERCIAWAWLTRNPDLRPA